MFCPFLRSHCRLTSGTMFAILSSQSKSWHRVCLSTRRFTLEARHVAKRDLWKFTFGFLADTPAQGEDDLLVASWFSVPGLISPRSVWVHPRDISGLFCKINRYMLAAYMEFDWRLTFLLGCILVEGRVLLH